MSNYLPILPRSYNEICCFPTASYPTPSTKRHSRIVILSVSTIVAALIVLISLNYSGDSQLYQDNPIPPLYAYYSKYPKPLLKSEDCADQVSIFLVIIISICCIFYCHRPSKSKTIHGGVLQS